MNFLRNNPNITRATTVLLVASLGAVGCSTTEEAEILRTEITPLTEIYEWPLEKVESRPTSGFELVDVINDDSYDCGYDFIDDEVECKWTYDDDYYGYNRRSSPIDSSTATRLELERREFVGSLDTPPTLDVPENTGRTHYSSGSFYEIEVVYTTGDSDKTRTCTDRIVADDYDESALRKALSGEVTYTDSWGNKSIQFKKDGDKLLQLDCYSS